MKRQLLAPALLLLLAGGCGQETAPAKTAPTPFYPDLAVHAADFDNCPACTSSRS